MRAGWSDTRLPPGSIKKGEVVKLTIVVPTLFGIRNPNYLPEVIDNLVMQCDRADAEYKIFVAGRHNEKYDAWENSKVTKEYLTETKDHDSHEVAWYLNEKLDGTKEGEYFCFFHDDLFIDEDNWIGLFHALYEQKDLNCGVLGVLSHTHSIIRRTVIGLYQCLYTNGAFFISTKLAKELKFDPTYKYECGDMDLSYELAHRGYKNYLVGLPYRHYMTPYRESLKNLDNFMDKLNDDRTRFNDKWKKKFSQEKMVKL